MFCAKNQIRLSNVWPNQNWIFRIFRRKLNFFCSVYHCVYHKMPRIRIIMHLFLRLGLSHFFFAMVQFDMWDLPKGFFYENKLRLHTLHFCLAAYTCRVVSLPLPLQSIWRCGKPQNHWNLPLEKSSSFSTTFYARFTLRWHVVNAMQNLLSKSDVNQKSCQGPPPPGRERTE